MAISLKNRKKEMIKNFGFTLIKLKERSLNVGFDAIRRCIFVYKKHFEALKARAMVKYLANYEHNLKRSTVTKFK